MEYVSDIYADDLLQHDIVRNSFKEISEKSQRIQDLLVIKQSIETYGLDPAVMAMINKDNQLVKELRLTENDLNRSTEGLSDVFNSGIMKKIIDGIKWLIDKIVEGIKWIWNKLMEWARSVNVDKAALKRAADNWDKLPDNAPLQPPDSSKPDIPWTNVPDFKVCKDRLTLAKQLCNDFINKYMSPLSEFATTYCNETMKNPTCTAFYSLLVSDRFKELRHNLMLSTMGGRGNILKPAMAKVYQDYIEKNKISSDWPVNQIVRIAEVRVKRDLGVRYKGEFNEVGITISDLDKTINAHKSTITTLETVLKKFAAQYDTIVKHAIANAKELEDKGNTYTAEMERNLADRYSEEIAQINDLLGALALVGNIVQHYIQIGTVNKLGLQELMKDIEIMFK